MSSTILYKFRSGTTFEALPLPGSAARLLDIKKAIVTAKKLDQGSIDFDLSVTDAASGAEYLDEAAILPRGTRLIVQRLPAPRGQGILAKIARSQYGGAPMSSQQQHQYSSNAPSDFYTIDSTQVDEDEFVSSGPSKEEQELAALRAATDAAAAAGSMGMPSRRGMGRGGPMGNFRQGPQVAGSGPPPPRNSNNSNHYQAHSRRPNADPELRDQEPQTKKRATGIPRTFLNLSAPPNTDGTDGSGNMPLLQPNTIGFEELVNRGGGQSENAAGTKRDLDYAIKLTATTIPEYLQCAICHSVVRDAMMLPWDPEGRTTCEQCIRTALTETGFRCPLTQQEGVSPDDLLPNHALRKAAKQFVSEVMERVQEIDKQSHVEETIVGENDAEKSGKVLVGDDKGVVLTRRSSAAEKRKKEEEDPFGGGDDDFGGDVFAVAFDETKDKEEEKEAADDNNDSEANQEDDTKIKKENEDGNNDLVSGPDVKEESAFVKKEDATDMSIEDKNADSPQQQPEPIKTETHQESDTGPDQIKSSKEYPKRETTRRRGPPVGYTMGPAVGAVDNAVVEAGPTSGHSPRENIQGELLSYGDRPYRGRGPPRGGRSYGGRFVGRGGRGSYQDNYPSRDDVSEVVALTIRVCALLYCSSRNIVVAF
jgi:DWNN domain